MTHDGSAPATKEDINILMNEMGKFYLRFEDQSSKLDLWKEEVVQKMDLWKQEIKDHFDLVRENQLYDFKGAFKDRTEDHERRIQRLEKTHSAA